MGGLKPTFKKRGIAVLIAALIASSVIITGTFAWFSLAQRITNEFLFEPCDVRLIKLDSDTHMPLQGAVFDLFDFSGKLVRKNLVTDKNGEITVVNLDQSLEYYFVETAAPHGYEIETAETELFPPDGREITVYNKRKSSSLTIIKTISEKDIEGNDYTITQEDLEFPFAFTVKIGNDPDAEYRYAISGVNGTIRSGEKIYLRHGEIAVFDNLPSLTTYSVIEDNYFIIEYNRDFDPGTHDYGCSNAATDGHSEHFATARGWVGHGHNTMGSIPETGAVVTYENKFVPDGYEVTISSLVVVDRIIAHQDDIDPTKAFEVTIVIGNNPDQQYFYEVVHIEDSVPHIDGYDHDYDYYNRNDPTPQYHTGKGDDVEWSGSPSSPAAPAAKAARFGMPVSLAAPNPPLHYPHDNERWPGADGKPIPDNLKTSAGNTIKVELFHASAIIVYGIPVGTQYSAEQVDYRFIDGYMIDSTYKTVGTILPDLEVLPDDDNNTDDTHLQRIRADIYNYFALPVMRTYEVQKNWIHDGPYGENPESERPASTVVHIIDQNTQTVFDSRELRSIESWADTMTVPKYDENGEIINYTLAEELPDGYIVTGLTETEDCFTLTNTYAPEHPGFGSLTVRKTIAGVGAEAQKEFRFTVTIGGDKQVIYLRGGDSRTFTGIPVGTWYSVVEDTYPDYTAKSSGSSGIIQKQGAVASFINTNDTPKEKSTLTITKAVQGGGDSRERFNFTVTLGRYIYDITLAGGEKYVFTDIPVGTHYSVREEQREGYIVSAEGTDGTITKSGNTAAFVNTASKAEGTGSLVITKETAGRFADTTKRFRFSVRIGNTDYEVYLKHGESYAFADIPAGTDYSVIEDDYSTQYYVTSSKGATGTITAGIVSAAFVNAYTSEIPPVPEGEAESPDGSDSPGTTDTPGASGTPGGTAPQTGDYTVTWTWFAVIFIGIAGLRIAVFWKRSGKK